MFCSPFRRRRRRRVEEGEERQLTREEAWHLYLAKLEEEANYFSVSDREEEPDLCTCHTCIVSIISQPGHNVQYPGALLMSVP